MPDKDHSLIQVEISGVVRDSKSNPIVLLKALQSDEVLPIWIGHAEALAIEMKLEGRSFERPLTHDLLKTALDTFGGIVVKVAVTELRNNTFFAKIFVKRRDEIIVVDARPSDSIALALRTKSPIFVSEDVFESHKRVLHNQEEPKEMDDEWIQKYLRDLDPGEF